MTQLLRAIRYGVSMKLSGLMKALAEAYEFGATAAMEECGHLAKYGTPEREPQRVLWNRKSWEFGRERAKVITPPDYDV